MTGLFGLLGFVTVTTAALLAKFTVVVPGVDPVRPDETVIASKVAEPTYAGGVY
jgi:hypothetical protein